MTWGNRTWADRAGKASAFPVISPIIKLNSSITKLNCSIDSLNQNMARNEARITHHGEQIDNHEHRITVLEEQAERRGSP